MRRKLDRSPQLINDLHTTTNVQDLWLSWALIGFKFKIHRGVVSRPGPALGASGPVRRLLLASAAFLAAGPATAADMPVKAPVPCCSDPWVGFYVGGNAGYSWGNVSTTASVAPFLQTNLFTYEFPGGAGSTSAHPNGPIAGGQAGYVWRVAPHWLAGIEGDYQWSGERGSAVGGFSGSTPDCTSGNCSYTDLTGITSRIGPFGTLRVRAGAEVNNVWVYGTAGLAVGTVSVSGTNTLTLIDNVSHTVVGLYPTSFSLSATKTGISAGGGFEGLIGTSNHWRWKAEFLYLDLGSIGGGTFGGVTVNTGRFTDDILRFGINYKFGDDCCALPPPCCATK